MKTKILLFSVLLWMPSFLLAQNIINVPGDYSSIQEGIDAAMEGDIVLVGDGTYYENINFNGKAITVASLYWDDSDTNHINNTVIDGSQPANPDNGSVVTFSSGEDTTSVIQGFTITGGTGTLVTSTGARYGGGIYCGSSGAKIINNKILNNTLESTIENACGGGIGCRHGSWIVIRDNTISDNIVTAENQALGGGIYSRYNSTIISNNVISHDSLFGYKTFGGGVMLSHTYYTEMTGNVITRNIVYHTDISWNGAYFYRPIGPVNIIQNEFSYNEAELTGDGSCGGLGFWEAYDYPVLVDGNRFLYNSAIYGGGFGSGISFNLKLTNNIFIGNNAQVGGAIRIWQQGSSEDYRPRIINNTFVNNSANWGGAISVSGNEMGSTPVVMNCIFWENIAPPNQGPDIDNWSDDTIYVYSSVTDPDLISFGPWSGQDNFLKDPELDTDSIHLLSSSPCINTGTVGVVINGDIFSAPDHDIDDSLRPQNILFDIGADEWDIDTRIEEFASNNLKFNVYPNPASDKISIEILHGEKVNSIEIIDIQGKVVLHQEETNNTFLVEVSSFPKGIYFVRVHTNEGVVVEKLIVQ